MTRPTHRETSTGAAVFPQGHDPQTIQLLPADYWSAHDDAMAIAAIKAQAEGDILAVAPLWQQLNDLRNPTPEGAARFAAIDGIRAKSNDDEALISGRKVKHGS